MKWTYSGDAAVTYPTYLDVTDPEHVKTLDAVPGETYEIRPAEGHTLPGEPDEDGNSEPVPVKLAMPPDDRWSRADKPEPKKKENS